MKKTFIRKLAVLSLCFAAVTATSISAYAADLTQGVAESSDTTLNITKTIKVTNPDLNSVDGPGMNYSYVIQPENPSQTNGGVTVTDPSDHTGTVHQGPTGGATLSVSGLSWPVGTAVDASAAGTDNTKTLQVTADVSKFSAPGIYRYKITETPSPADPASIGVTDEGDRVRYLDVYIVNSGTGLGIGGYTLHDGSNAKKTFDDAVFETLNIILENEVVGNMGDRQNQFPFEGLVKDNGRSFFAKKSQAPQAVNDNKVPGEASGSGITTTLAHGEKYYVSGLSKVSNVNYTENNNTPDVYSVSIEGGTPSDPSPVAAGSSKTMGETAVTPAAYVKFINSLDAVSPTGVVLRYGAPLSVVAAGAVLMMINRKSKSSDEA